MLELNRGIFIALEGVDGAGSSTQTKMLVASLREKGYDAVATKEPNPGGEVEPLIRHFLNGRSSTPELDALLFAADRADHVARLIEPWLESKKVVVSDRYLESSIAYQSSQGLGERWVTSINRRAVKPDITIIMDIDPSVSLKRKGTDPERFENVVFLSKVRRRFLERAKKRDYCVVDASQPVEEVHSSITRIVLPLLESVSRRP